MKKVFICLFGLCLFVASLICLMFRPQPWALFGLLFGCWAFLFGWVKLLQL